MIIQHKYFISAEPTGDGFWFMRMEDDETKTYRVTNQELHDFLDGMDIEI